MEHGSAGGSLEMAEGPEIFGGLLTNPREGSAGMFIILADDIELEGLQRALSPR